MSGDRVTEAVGRLAAADATIIREDVQDGPGPRRDGRSGKKRVLRALTPGVHPGHADKCKHLANVSTGTV
jgi:hypothetical protein